MSNEEKACILDQVRIYEGPTFRGNVTARKYVRDVKTLLDDNAALEAHAASLKAQLSNARHPIGHLVSEYAEVWSRDPGSFPFGPIRVRMANLFMNARNVFYQIRATHPWMIPGSK